MSGWQATADVRRTLKVFTWARAQHRLRLVDLPVSFSGAVALIGAETGLDDAKLAAVLAGGFSSEETQRQVAAWNGLLLAAKHGAPVLVVDRDAATADAGVGSYTPSRARPLAPGELIARLAARQTCSGSSSGTAQGKGAA